jgi:hypothetical protein
VQFTEDRQQLNLDMREEVELLLTEGYNVYIAGARQASEYRPDADLPSWKQRDNVYTSPSQPGPWLRVDGSYWCVTSSPLRGSLVGRWFWPWR